MPGQPDDDHDARRPDSDDDHDASSAYVGAYDKLVRDDIPAVVRDDGNEPITRRVDGAERDQYLAAKLVEEAREYAAVVDARPDADATGTGSGGSENGTCSGGDDAIDEIADVHAVLDAIVDRLAAATNRSRDDVLESVRARQREKAADRGAFAAGIVLERIDPPDRVENHDGE